MTEFKKKYNLVAANDEILNTPLENFDMKNPPVDPEELAKELVGHMRHFGGIGLCANQLGLPYKVFTMEGDPAFVCFNPRITAHAGDEVLLEEGCLSYPGIVVNKKRKSNVTMLYQTLDNPVQKAIKLTKLANSDLPHIIQHEVDHLNGVCIRSRNFKK